MNEIKIDKVKIGGKNNPVVLIAGPCVIESRESAIRHAKFVKELTDRLDIPYIFKASYDKANRSSVKSFRGPGLKEGLKILKEVKDKFDLPILSDVHNIDQIKDAKEVLDIIQIPAFLCRQTDLVVAAAKTGKIINIKKGQFLAPWDIKNIIDKITESGNKKVTITERGVSFGYNNLVSDFRSIMIMKELGYPIVYDATHSVQLPGGEGCSSGGESKFVPGLVMAAISVGADAIFIEVHENPKKALCDGPNSIALKDLEELLVKMKTLGDVVRSL